MEGYLYMEDRGESTNGQRWGTPVTPAARKLQAAAEREAIEPRKLIALDKAALGVSENWRDRMALKCAKRKESSVRVIARFRPPSGSELEAEGRDCERAFRAEPSNGHVYALEGTQSWDFDVAFGEDCTQQAVYNATGRPVIDGLLDGYNGTIFAYGQTGSGKTHCMFGPSQEHWYQASSSDGRGIVPRAVHHVFNHIRDGVLGTEFILRCSLFEVYREQLRDLLDPANPNLRIKETPRQGVFVDGLAQEFVSCEDDVVTLLRQGSRLRAVAATRLNQHSSRSHVIFSLTCEQRLIDGTEKLAKLNLVDLAGSEKVWKSSSSGTTLEEAKKINLSLSALGNVISALASRRGHVPYRNSKLTRILQETLGGNFKTALIVTCSPLRMHLDETLSSLHFATRAKAVCNHVKVNFVYSAEQLMAFVEQLQQELLTTRREIAKTGHTAATIPFPEAGASEQHDLDGADASLSDDASGTCVPSAPSREPKRNARLIALLDETKPVLMRSLWKQEELIGELKAVKGAAMHHELRRCATSAPVGETSGTGDVEKMQRSSTWEALLLQQCVFNKMVEMQDLSRELAAQHRSYKGVGRSMEITAKQIEHLDEIISQLNADLQTAREAVVESRHSPPSSPSRPHSPRERQHFNGTPCRGTSPRDRRMSAGSPHRSLSPRCMSAGSPCRATSPRERRMSLNCSEASFTLRAGPTSMEDVPQVDALPQFVQSSGGNQASALDANDAEADRLRHELEMLRMDFERENHWRHLKTVQAEQEKRRWMEWAKARVDNVDQCEEQTCLEEQRLRDLQEKRYMEISRTRKMIAQKQAEVLAKKHEIQCTRQQIELQRAAQHSDDSMWSKAKEIEESVNKLKERRAALQGDRYESASWSAQLGA